MKLFPSVAHLLAMRQNFVNRCGISLMTRAGNRTGGQDLAVPMLFSQALEWTPP
jgi:hypothetical protein